MLVKKFLEYGAKHTVEQVQSFTANKIPCPSWVSKEEVVLSDRLLAKSASILIDNLGPTGLRTFGGSKWWQYRVVPLRCEWIEMKKDRRAREGPTAGHKVDRVILYIHGGAYYFGSVDEHRYQIQRHARKLGGRAFAANYRLSPQFPAPCGIHDNLAAYLYLLETYRPENIILSGDSAGGGMCLALLLVMRDQGIPMPAGCVLISPWVDLNHSFPSIMADSSGDYIPPSGFQHKPSISWPPPTADDMAAARQMKLGDESDSGSIGSNSEDGQGFTVEEADGAHAGESQARATIVGNQAEILIDGKLVTIKDQIQLYATNEQISHPLVSPVVAGSLGGLCPLFIMCGGSELLRDEIIYTAHKAANPPGYPPMEAYLDRDPRQRETLEKYAPTTVHLQVYDECCHVTPTISMCRPAKYMYRAIANFSLWALARFEGAQQRDIADLLKVLNLASARDNRDGNSSSEESASAVEQRAKHAGLPEVKVSGVEPVYVANMIRERVSIYGLIRQMEPASEIAALSLAPEEIGVIKPGPVQKFMTARGAHDRRYSRRKQKLQRERAREYARAEREGFAIGDFEGDKPPPAALAGRASLAEAERIHKSSEGSKSGGLINTMFSLVSGSRDKDKAAVEARAQK